jgi:gluconokinase
VKVIIVMGVAGSGKSTLAAELVRRTGWDFAEADDYHSAANVAKMRAGHPLTDEDRWPWLDAIARWISERERAGQGAIVTCSALKRSYRDRLRAGHLSVWFVHLDVPVNELDARLERRAGHFLPASLLASQLDVLEPLAAGEPGVTVAADRPVGQVAADVLEGLRPDA